MIHAKTRAQHINQSEEQPGDRGHQALDEDHVDHHADHDSGGRARSVARSVDEPVADPDSGQEDDSACKSHSQHAQSGHQLQVVPPSLNHGHGVLSPAHPGRIKVIIRTQGSGPSVRLAIVARDIHQEISYSICYLGPGCRRHEYLMILSTTCACHGQRNSSISHMINKHPQQGHRGCLRPWFHTAMAMKGNIVCAS